MTSKALNQTDTGNPGGFRDFGPFTITGFLAGFISAVAVWFAHAAVDYLVVYIYRGLDEKKSWRKLPVIVEKQAIYGHIIIISFIWFIDVLAAAENFTDTVEYPYWLAIWYVALVLWVAGGLMVLFCVAFAAVLSVFFFVLLSAAEWTKKRKEEKLRNANKGADDGEEIELSDTERLSDLGEDEHERVGPRSGGYM